MKEDELIQSKPIDERFEMQGRTGTKRKICKFCAEKMKSYHQNWIRSVPRFQATASENANKAKVILVKKKATNTTRRSDGCSNKKDQKPSPFTSAANHRCVSSLFFFSFKNVLYPQFIFKKRSANQQTKNAATAKLIFIIKISVFFCLGLFQAIGRCLARADRSKRKKKKRSHRSDPLASVHFWTLRSQGNKLTKKMTTTAPTPSSVCVCSKRLMMHQRDLLHQEMADRRRLWPPNGATFSSRYGCCWVWQQSESGTDRAGWSSSSRRKRSDSSKSSSGSNQKTTTTKADLKDLDGRRKRDK